MTIAIKASPTPAEMAHVVGRRGDRYVIRLDGPAALPATAPRERRPAAPIYLGVEELAQAYARLEVCRGCEFYGGEQTDPPRLGGGPSIKCRACNCGRIRLGTASVQSCFTGRWTI